MKKLLINGIAPLVISLGASAQIPEQESINYIITHLLPATTSTEQPVYINDAINQNQLSTTTDLIIIPDSANPTQYAMADITGFAEAEPTIAIYHGAAPVEVEQGDDLEAAILNEAGIPYFRIPAVDDTQQLDPYITLINEYINPTAVKPKISPQGFVIGEVYPNPFNSQTTIPLSLSIPESVEATFYNMAGQEVHKTRRDYPAGSHTITWDGTDRTGASLPSGIYVIKVSSDNAVMNKKITLIK